MYKQGIDMRVYVNGRSVREYNHNGNTFIESRHGSNYTIKIKNDNAHRVMAVVSVDGLDVITGKPAEDSDKGYIVDSYSSTEIKGYRLSDTDSAAFVFVSKDKSYTTNATGDPRNSGVIGIRVFEEKVEKPKEKVVEKHIHHHHNHYYKHPWNPYYPSHPPVWYTTGGMVYGTTTGGAGSVTYTANASTPLGVQPVSYTSANLSQTYVGGGTTTAAYTANNNVNLSLNNSSAGGNVLRSMSNSFDSPITYDSFDTGTSWGQKQTDKIKKEYFEKGKLVGELVMYYASHDALVNMGIDMVDLPKIAEMPKAFGNYCQPPKGWVG